MGGKAMIANRSVPTDTVLPHVVYRDVAEAIDWLTKTFGFEEHYRYGEPGGEVSGAQMHLGNAWIMVFKARARWGSPAQLGHGTQSLTVFVEDVDGHFRRTKAAGAKIVEELHETEYGETAVWSGRFRGTSLALLAACARHDSGGMGGRKCRRLRAGSRCWRGRVCAT